MPESDFDVLSSSESSLGPRLATRAQNVQARRRIKGWLVSE